jgi:hypothetical protein
MWGQPPSAVREAKLPTRFTDTLPVIARSFPLW